MSKCNIKKKKRASTRVRSRTRKMHTEDLPTMAAAQAKAFSRLNLNSEAGKQSLQFKPKQGP